MLRVIIASLLLVISADAALAQTAETIVIDGSAPAHPFPHFWEQMFGSGRAILSLREDYRQDLQAVKQITGFRYVRFHAVFDDEIGVYDEDKQGQPVFNFSYVDQIYDGLLAKSVRPFVELSFMPNKLAAEPILQAFWYKPDVSPPKDWTKWDDLITQFAKHLVDRYGIDEVSHWYFEVWNEPNIDFWAGNPQAGDLLGPVRPHRARSQGGEPSLANWRTGDGPGSLGGRFYSALRGQPRSR